MKFQEKGSTAKKHFYISVTKSILRLFACLCLGYKDFVGAAIIFGVAEGLGILEEIA